MENYTIYEQFLTTLAECLCVNLFKKYYYVKGSFENRKLNKNSIDNLNDVIKDANHFTKLHIQQTTQLSFIFVPSTILYFLFVDNKKTFELAIGFLVLYILEFYALMVHEYNRIIARKQIEYLKKNNIDKSNNIIESNIINENYKEFIIFNTWYYSELIKIKIKNKEINLIFLSIEKAKKFIDYLEDKFDKKLLEKVLYNININNMNMLYKEFYNE